MTNQYKYILDFSTFKLSNVFVLHKFVMKHRCFFSDLTPT